MNLAFFEDLFSDDSEPDFTGLYDKPGRELRLFLRTVHVVILELSHTTVTCHVTPVTPK